MTRAELSALEVLIGEFREFREGDARWKAGVDQRLRAVEQHVASQQAVDAREESRLNTRRAWLGLLFTAIGVVFSIAIGLYNALA